MSTKTLLLTGTSGFIGYNFLNYILPKNYNVIDILRIKNKKNNKIKKLRKKYNNNYKNIFYSKYSDLEKKLKNLKVDYFINFATLYKNNHSHKDISNFVESNILFPTLIYDLISKKVKKVINFGTMMQHKFDEKLDAKNFYAATKNAFEMIGNFYSNNEKKTKFYNLKFYESFGKDDLRKKIVPTIIKNYKKNRTTKIISKNLELNIIHTNDIINAIMIILNNNLKSGSYCLKNKKNIKIVKLIDTLNKNLKRNIKVKYLKKSISKIRNVKLKKLPKWEANNNLINTISLNFKK